MVVEAADGVRLAAARVAVALALGAGLVRGARAEDIADPTSAPWEHEVDRAVREQDERIESARRNRSMSSVVTQYASRVSRESTPLNHFLLGRALYHNGDPNGARAQMQIAVDGNRDFWPAHMRLAMLLAELKNAPAAERHLREVLARKPAYEPAMRHGVNLALEQKDWARARRLLEDLLRRRPDDLELRAGLAKLHMQVEDWGSAVAQLRLVKSRRPADLDVAWLLGTALLKTQDVAGGIAELERFAAGRPDDPRGWARLYDIRLARREWAKAADALQRLLPLLAAERRSEAGKVLEILRSDRPESLVEADAPAAPTWKDVFAKAASEKVDDRLAALLAIRSALEAEVLDHVPYPLLLRILPSYEPDDRARRMTLRILVRLGTPRQLPLLSLALYDPVPEVRRLAAEGIGDLGFAAGVVYLLPQLVATDPAEYESVRSSLARLTQFDDRAPDAPVRTPEDVAASREAWRVWRLSDEGRDVRVEAVRQAAALGDAGPERYLVEFVGDPAFEVMREAYVALREASKREPPKDDPLAAKLLPRFPRVEDAQVTRATMRSIQDRVRAWWAEWNAERRALLKAAGR